MVEPDCTDNIPCGKLGSGVPSLPANVAVAEGFAGKQADNISMDSNKNTPTLSTPAVYHKKPFRFYIKSK
jgi:hypothetical protein